jgi:hypothetical protein
MDGICQLAAQLKSNLSKLARHKRKAIHFRAVEEVEMIADVARLPQGSISGVILDSANTIFIMAPRARMSGDTSPWASPTLP